MSPKAKIQAAAEILIKACEACGKPFRTVHEHATICGAYECVATTTWDDARWEGQRRTANARALAGIDPQPLDHAAADRP